MTWENLPQELVELVQKRVAEDSLAASHVLRAGGMYVIRVVEDQAVTLEDLVSPSAVTTILVDVAPHATLIMQESHEGVLLQENTFMASLSGVEDAYSSAFVLLRIGEGARVQWFGQSVSAPGFAVVERFAILARDAVLEHHSALLAANALRENVHVILNAPGATARINTLFAGNHDHQFDLGVTAEHRAPHTVSNLAAKGVLAGKAQAVIRGLVRIEREAPGSDGYQRCDTLLLSPTAEVDPVPTLEINTNDVRCTHGVTTGHLNPDHLFYLQSRGFSAAAARALLVDGFLGSVLEKFPDPPREELRAAADSVLFGTSRS